MLIEILGKCPQIKVLDYLLSNPFESYTKQQIAIGAEISRSTLDKFIDKLLENKILILKNSKYELNFNSEIVKKLDALQEYLAKKELEKQSSYETEEFIKYSDEELDKLFDENAKDVDLDKLEKEIELNENILINNQEYRQLKYNITCPSKNPKNSYDKLDLTNTKKYYKIGGF